MKKRKKRAPRFGDSPFQESSAKYQDRWAPEDPDSVDVDDLIERYGKYLDENDQPLKGINPNPKYYVLPKEPSAGPQAEPPAPPEPEPPKTNVRTTLKRTVKAVKKPLPKVTPKRVDRPAPEPEPKPEPPVVMKPVKKEAPNNTIPVKIKIKRK
ncbi:MAG: hypothetical protein J5847_06040 [Clostridia bacterium]|nr:hypothetical protein [Clostridia bacterium]